MTAPATPTQRSARSVVAGLVTASRPRQWLKNGLVVAAPAMAGRILEPDVAAAVALAFVAFTLAATGTYLLNDVRDRQIDAAHPEKRHRPIAAGTVPVGLAVGVAVLAVLSGVAVALLAGLTGLALVVGSYVLMTTAYSSGLKRVPMLELVIVAAGFVLRTVAGAVAADIPVSNWFLIVVSAVALYIVATKRFAELRDQEHGVRRHVLHQYSSEILSEVRFAAVAVALTAHVLWSFERGGGSMWFELSSVPFTLTLFRYGAVAHDGAGESPEEILMGDRHLLAYAVVWAALVGLGVWSEAV